MPDSRENKSPLPSPDALRVIQNPNRTFTQTNPDELFKLNPIAVVLQGVKQWLEEHPILEKALATLNIVGGVLQTSAGVAAGIWAIISISSLANSISITASSAISSVASAMGSSSGMVIASLVLGVVVGAGMIVMGVLTHNKYKKKTQSQSSVLASPKRATLENCPTKKPQQE